VFEDIKKVHCIGIGGIGVSGIAEILISYGYSVSGSDMRKNSLTERLELMGAKIHYKHRRKNLGDAQVVVYSSAIQRSNPELDEAFKRNIPVIRRGEMLSEILRKGFSIAVSGAHGKTTTTAMISNVLRSGGVKPTVIIGGIIRGASKNAITGKGKIFVAEADESDGTFRTVRANIAVITNLDKEHMDHYGSSENMDKAYLEFMNGVPFDGLIACCGDDSRLRKLAQNVKRRLLTYGVKKNNDLIAENIKRTNGMTVFNVRMYGKRIGSISLPSAGTHNVQNALATCAVAMELGLSFRKISMGFKEFEGIERRMEVKGELEGCTVVDDYAHHPTEIASTLDAARSIWNGRRFVVVFQPHRYSRTKSLMSLFPKAFKQADMVLVTDIYGAGEKRIKNVKSTRLVNLLKKKGSQAMYLKNWKKNLPMMKDLIKDGDVIFSFGAGDINRFYDYFKGCV